MSISLSFDIGHSSIGWAALNVTGDHPDVLGCGSVVFPPEDCQNQQRAGFRRQRRHIAATRNRIKRLEAFLVACEILSEADVVDCRANPHPWPWLLAAQVIKGDRILNGAELWSVLRWYAHNRGYDGNALWAGEDSDPDDVKKVQAARELMDRHDTSTMCETVCALLDVDVSSDQNPRLEYYFKGENAAFPRSVVVEEVRAVLVAHIGKIKGISDSFIESMLTDWTSAQELGFNAKLPARFTGGLLFGQLKPRFENRIIPTCRITGEKTPSKHTREFYRYRWAMLMNNLRVDDPMFPTSRPLSLDERQRLNDIMETEGFFTKVTLKKALEKTLGLVPSNLEAMFLIPEMEQALTLDPARREVSGKILKPIWAEIPEGWRSLFLNQLFHGRNYKGRVASLTQWRSRILEKGDLPKSFDDALERACEVEKKNLEKKGLSVSLEEFCNRPIRLSGRHVATGRAPYSRVKLIEAVECVMQGEDPRGVEGPLEESELVRNMQRDRSVDENTNNHLVRHRLKIFERTLADLIKRYADNDPRLVSSVGVEVVRDLVQFSGKTAKEKAQLLGAQLAHHRKISRYLNAQHEAMGGSFKITPGLIKKVRIADDMDWTCPYTGKRYSLSEIVHGEVDREHIIPRSKRPTDSMHALVLTFSKINKEKGARTGLQYIEETQDSSHTFTPKQYKEFVRKLKRKNGPSKDDELRCTKRKIALLTRDYEPRGKAKQKSAQESVSGFTEGSLSQTSHLNKLAAQQVRHWFASKLAAGDKQPEVVQLSGSVTAATRRTWNLFDQLNEACPETRDKIKTDIREITHLHHALDAILVGLSAFYFPKDGHLWALMSKRKVRNTADQRYMRSCLGKLVSFSSDGEWEIEPLIEVVQQSITERLIEKRVVRHNPRTMRGLRVQQNVWRVVGQDPDDDSKMLITMRPRDEDGVKSRKRNSEKKTKLFGSQPKEQTGKLHTLKGAIRVEDNYGVALDPEPKVIPYQQVWKQIQFLKQQNGGRPVRVLRKGNVIRVKEGRNAGDWVVKSIKDTARDGIRISILPVEAIQAAPFVPGLKSLIKNGLQILDLDFSYHIR